jgi:hypothetical protein
VGGEGRSQRQSADASRTDRCLDQVTHPMECLKAAFRQGNTDHCQASQEEHDKHDPRNRGSQTRGKSAHRRRIHRPPGVARRGPDINRDHRRGHDGYRRGVKLAEVLLLITAVLLPPALGVAAALLRRAWWWAAMLGVVIAMVAVIAPEPEAGESRVTSGDLPFLLVVALWVISLVWLTNYLTVRFWVRRREPRSAAAA